MFLRREPPAMPTSDDSSSPATAESLHQQPPMDDFLQEQASTGAYDSPGVFTINRQAALIRMAEFQLPDRYAWILLLVGSANRGMAHIVDVRQWASVTSISLVGGVHWDWEELHAVLVGAPTDKPGMLELASVIRALCHQRPAATFTIKPPYEAAQRWNGTSFELQPTAALGFMAQGQAVLEFHHCPIEVTSRAEVEKVEREARAALYRYLTLRCNSSSVPISCDSLQIAGVHSTSSPSRRILTILPVLGGKVPPIRFLLPPNSEAAVRGAKIVFTSGNGPAQADSGWAALMLIEDWPETRGSLHAAQAQSSLSWIRDGLLMGRADFSLSSRLGLRIWLSAQGRAADLTGLSLVRNQALLKRQTYLLAQMVEALQAVLQEGETSGQRFHTGNGEASTVVVLGLSALAGLAVPITLLAAPVVAAGVAFSGYLHQRSLNWDQMIQGELKLLIDDFAEFTRQAEGQDQPLSLSL